MTTDLAPLIEKARTERDECYQVAVDIVTRAAGRSLSFAEELDVEQYQRQGGVADNRLRRLQAIAQGAPKTSPAVRVTKEPLTYGRRPGESQHSAFADLALAKFRSNPASLERLERHRREMFVEGRALPAPYRERRAGPNSTTTSVFLPPIWMNEYWASIPRVERVLAALAGGRFDLPDGTGSSINVPRVSAGTTAAGGLATEPGATPTGNIQQNAQAVGGTDLTDAQISCPIVTIGGEEDSSLQLLEQSPPDFSFDQIMASDLAAAADQDLEDLILNGTGLLGAPLGLLNVAGAGSVTYTDAAPTAVKMAPYLAQTFAAVSHNRRRKPSAWLMTGSRWAWLNSGEDAQNRPLNLLGPPPDTGRSEPVAVGSMLGVPVYVDDALPVASGADEIVACCAEDLMVWVGTPHFSVFDEVLSSTLSVRFRLHLYAACAMGRYPTGTAVLSGTGCTVQSGF